MENKQQIPLNQLCIPDCDGNMVLTRNIINEEEADDGMNSGGDEGDISPIYTYMFMQFPAKILFSRKWHGTGNQPSLRFLVQSTFD